MEKKTFKAQLRLEGDEGAFKAIFAQMNVIDHHKDVTTPGAFAAGQEVVIEGWNHDYGLPVGKGKVQQDEKFAWIEGRFFTDTEAGKQHYLTLKNLDGVEEWSYTFNIETAEEGTFEGQSVRFLKKLDVWGVAPVTRGAGIGTRTVELKGWQVDAEAVRRALEQFLNEKAGDPPGGGEGEAGDGKPSTTSVGVYMSQIEILSLEGDDGQEN